jgi:hypothetical protein
LKSITLKPITMERKTTESGKSYWNENGAYQTEYDKLYGELVPSRGEADTVHGEMIRAVSRLFYDFCNNGNCNAVEVQQEPCDYCGGDGYEDEICNSCDGDGEVEYEEDNLEPCYECDGEGYIHEDCHYCGGDCYVDGEAVITSYYQDMIDFLHSHLTDSKVVDNLESFMTRNDIGYGTYTFNDDEMKPYNDVVDAVMYQVLTTENEKRLVKDLDN